MARSPSRNPLGVDPEREQRVRERAYHLWEADGKPHGRDVEYWERARELVSKEESASTPTPATKPDSPPETSIEEAASTKNRGVVPARMADQGGVKPTPEPVPKRKARAKPKKPA